MTSAISESVSFLRENSFRTICARIRERNVPGLIQFGIYSICGGLATVTFLATVIILSKTLIPAYEGMVVDGATIGDKLRAEHLLVNNCIGFVLANFVAYFTNILFVFKQGRHHPVLEFFIFTAVSGSSFAISQLAGPWLVARWGVPTNVEILSNLVASMMLNFVGRKFIVFKG
jgi:putative flippase GtrA